MMLFEYEALRSDEITDSYRLELLSKSLFLGVEYALFVYSGLEASEQGHLTRDYPARWNTVQAASVTYRIGHKRTGEEFEATIHIRLDDKGQPYYLERQLAEYAGINREIDPARAIENVFLNPLIEGGFIVTAEVNDYIQELRGFAFPHKFNEIDLENIAKLYARHSKRLDIMGWLDAWCWQLCTMDKLDSLGFSPESLNQIDGVCRDRAGFFAECTRLGDKLTREFVLNYKA